MTTTTPEPAYLALQRGGELAVRARLALNRLASCDLCARYCRVDRRRHDARHETTAGRDRSMSIPCTWHRRRSARVARRVSAKR